MPIKDLINVLNFIDFISANSLLLLNSFQTFLLPSHLVRYLHEDCKSSPATRFTFIVECLIFLFHSFITNCGRGDGKVKSCSIYREIVIHPRTNSAEQSNSFERIHNFHHSHILTKSSILSLSLMRGNVTRKHESFQTLPESTTVTVTEHR